MNSRRARKPVLSYQEILTRLHDQRTDPSYRPVRLPLGRIDSAIGGVYPGQVLGVGARSGVGKSQLLATFERAFALEQRDAGCLTMSLEMSPEKWAERSVAMSWDEPRELVEASARRGTIAVDAAGFVEEMRHAFMYAGGVHVSEAAAVTQEARERLGAVPLRLVLIDYAGRIYSDGRSDYERASAVALALKDFALEQEVVVVVAMQLSRAGGDGSVAVSMDMIRDSGQWEEALDFLVGAWRPGKAAGMSEQEQAILKNVVRLCLLKNRDGDDFILEDMIFRSPSRLLELGAVI